MSLELANTLATFGTFVVIAATAIAALVQLRHMRSSNQITALSDLYEKQRLPEFIAARQFIFSGLPEKMQDPAFRYQVVHRAARTEENAAVIAKILEVGNYYEETGVLVRSGLVDREFFLRLYSANIAMAWEGLGEVIAIWRERFGSALYENFEYVTVLARDWDAEHPGGTYPANVPRIDLPNKWLEADKQYAASLAPA
jgi:hypothetical protein